MLSRKSHIALIPTFALLLLVAAGLASATWASDQEGPDFEPAISANGLFLVGYTKLEDPDGAPTSRTGLFAQQVELHMAAHVDTDLVGEISLLLPRGSRTVDQVEIGETFVIARLSP
ncbi:MAG: hypothetical protein HOC74_07730, partial [Gemmatimonadetes bacterium]|nr:hypothetical protein [Gemmatimonadota bacterium]